MATRLLIFSFFLLFLNQLSASDSLYFKMHFVYGSKPKKAFKATEHKIFGGIHGGHVYTEVKGKIISFGPNNGQWHIFQHKKNIVGKYRVDKDLKWHGDTSKIKIATVLIPITQTQAERYKQVTDSFLLNSPYDYAFFGMRCAAAAYDVSALIGISKHKRRGYIIRHHFYPQRLRIKILKRAKKEGWQVITQEGRNTRIWERD